MIVPLKWLRNYVDIDVDAKEFADKMTMSGSKVEKIDFCGEGIENVVVGEILEIKKHGNADKLIVTKVDIGNKILQIVTGAENVSKGDYVPIAVDGALLPGGTKIKENKLRGEISQGMMCSGQELGIDSTYIDAKSKTGILLLTDLTQDDLGKDVREILGLNDAIIEFEITSNRPDCRCIIGIAREAAVTLGKKIRYPNIEVKESNENACFDISIENEDLCKRYASRIVKNVTIKQSPYWIQRRLIEAGVRPINNIVDITNYVMLEMGQPMHAFDLDYITNKKIVVRNASDGEIFKTLDGVERKLDDDMLMITDGVKSLAIAGVMGGLNSEVTVSTSSILLESANFKAENIRATSKKLGLRTEASSRFEKGIDSQLAESAVNRAAHLIEMLNAGTVLSGIIDKYPVKSDKKIIKINPNRINKLIGVEIPKNKIIEILESLEFNCINIPHGEIQAEVPSYRLDMEQEADFTEEVARIYGYNNIPLERLDGNPTIGIKTKKQKFRRKIKRSCISMGNNEILTYSFVSPKGIDKSDRQDDKSKAVKIINPLGAETSVMRTTLIPNMVEVLSNNMAHGIDEMDAFEYGNTFTITEEIPKQSEKLCIGLYGKDRDFFTLKGMLEAIFREVGFKNYEICPENNNTVFHPGRCAKIVYNNRYTGVLGELHPDVMEKHSLSKRVYILEIDTDFVFENCNDSVLYRSLPKYPSTSRDIALVVKDSIYVKQIDDIIRENGSGIVEKFELFDVYTGDQIEKGYKSIAYSITYRSKDKTLTDEEVSVVHNKILDELSKKIDANLRSS